MDFYKKYNIEQKEIVIPKGPKTPIKRPKTAVNNPHQTRGMFKVNNIDYELQTFDVVKPAPETGEKMLRVQNPGLLAIKKKATKAKQAQKTAVARPKTPLLPSPAQMMTSLLTHQRLAHLKEPDETAYIHTFQKHVDEERLAISFNDDLLAYFSKRKDGRGHRFIYLIYKGDRNDPNFNPYELVKVPFAEITPDYFTMSANGVTHIHPDGNTENFSLDRWAKESSNFITLKKYKFFKFYFIWKPFRIWKKFVMRQRYDQFTDKVMKNSMINNYIFYQTAMDFVKETPGPIIKKHLLIFQTQKKYTLDEYFKTEREYRNQLNTLFLQYINNKSSGLYDIKL